VSGEEVALRLARGVPLRGGDWLRAEDGRLIRVEAAPEAVVHITCGGAAALARAAYHLGNRHVPIELQPDHLKIEPDHVLADMLRAMHLIVNEVLDPFEPESGAYGDHGGGHHHPSHAHPHHAHGPHSDHDHDHDHGHGHSKPHAP
jgi:urease accessory protein